MAIRSTPRTIYDNTPCPYCKAKPDSACHDRNGYIRSPHKARKDHYNRLMWETRIHEETQSG